MKTTLLNKADSPGQTVLTSPEYREFIDQLKSRVQAARISATRAINAELILLYWDIGQGIVEKQKALDWGESVVELVAADLRRAFPGVKGLSARNVWDMRRLYLAYTDTDFLSILSQKLALPKRYSILRQVVAESEGKKKTADTDGTKIRLSRTGCERIRKVG